MYVAGCDLGSTTGKAVILHDDQIVAWTVIRAAATPEKIARTTLGQVVEKAGLRSIEDIQCIVGTGYGRMSVPFLHENVSEITCHAHGAYALNPAVRTVIDVGGQDCKVISLGDGGKVLDFAMNDKCAAGTGKFFEAMARALDCSLDQMAALALESTSPAQITKQCSVFAESEVVTLVNSGVSLADISAGLHDSIARRLQPMIFRVGLTSEVALTGGCAQNTALIKALEARIGMSITHLAENPQIVGAFGAALFARQRAKATVGSGPCQA